MHTTHFFAFMVALLGAVEAQQATYTSGKKNDDNLVGSGYRCYEQSGTVKEVDADKGVLATFYNGKHCEGTQNIAFYGESHIKEPFNFKSIKLSKRK